MELLTRIDYYLLLFIHDFFSKWDRFLTPFSKFLSFLGKDGICLFLIAVVLMLFRRTRKIGICVFGAIGAGAILSNVWIKDAVARPRPFETFNDIRMVGSLRDQGIQPVLFSVRTLYCCNGVRVWIWFCWRERKQVLDTASAVFHVLCPLLPPYALSFRLYRGALCWLCRRAGCVDHHLYHLQDPGALGGSPAF